MANDMPDPMDLLRKAMNAMDRADSLISGFTSSDIHIRRAEANIQLAHAYMRLVELTTIKGGQS
jgi:hypothetical protein